MPRGCDTLITAAAQSRYRPLRWRSATGPTRSPPPLTQSGGRIHVEREHLVGIDARVHRPGVQEVGLPFGPVTRRVDADERGAKAGVVGARDVDEGRAT